MKIGVAERMCFFLKNRNRIWFRLKYRDLIEKQPLITFETKKVQTNTFTISKHEVLSFDDILARYDQ